MLDECAQSGWVCGRIEQTTQITVARCVRAGWEDAHGMYHLFLFSGGFLIGLVVAVPIGPVNLICIRRTLSYGTLSGFLSGLGGALGDGVFACVTAFGLTAISQLIEGFSAPLQLMGGIMLLGFGLTVFQTDVSALRAAESAPVRDRAPSPVRMMLSTFALTIANPATLFGFTALFAGFGSLAGEDTTFLNASVTVLGVIAGSTSWWFMLTTFVGIFHGHINPGVMRTINHVFGVLVSASGAVVLGNLVMGLA
jgi:threonine/homoserine/homoserine lactone efflux protein